ncbi:methyl-accepting chemotaxis protein [Paenibacillus mendelii]|uniref:Methyl-accepting chemotaxis protein n=1 Tax=Paenibacillus mendelii TaxID=206163 RepID=A0ABV6JDF4_9BACL|nr:methyl-accepting chemotaxis protein [Paenibacillus mendelii]
MFDWLGWRKGLPLWWSTRLNRGLKDEVAEIFEGIADTRIQLLQAWTNEYWGHLERLSVQLAELHHLDDSKDAGIQADVKRLFASSRLRASDFSELFLLDASDRVLYSTYDPHCDKEYGTASIIAEGLRYAKEVPGGRSCLFGPYRDPYTEEIGPSTSTFHDEMTLLFIAPIVQNGNWMGAVCGRVPNDVIGDLIQRESGHVYPDSGDNYIFMAKPMLNKHIAPGTALSRSRFEDHTFTHGENLKDGVTTDWGSVSVKQHTELELIFTDPATGELHPGVFNTIKNGSNLFVEFPGYSDYRHIQVIGKGVTFQLPHCPDLWGMMCEGDLEEVYRIRSMRWSQTRFLLKWAAVYGVAGGLLSYMASSFLQPWAGAVVFGLFNILLGLYMILALDRKVNRRIVSDLRRLTGFIRINAEGKGDLTQRLDAGSFGNDETRELAKWINNMIDSLEGIMLQVKLASVDVWSSQRLMKESTAITAGTTEKVNVKINDMLQGIRNQLQDIEVAKEVADEMRQALRKLEEKASEQIELTQGELRLIGGKMEHISERVTETNRTIHAFMETTNEIRSILSVIEEVSAQTNLLALNASIEAARVGEQGRGFAVVATEIRKLADLTQTSTDQVHQIVRRIYDNAQHATVSMEEGTRVVQEGKELVAAASDTLRSANADDSLKSQVIDRVVELMENIAQVSMLNRTISTEVESKVQELMNDFINVRYQSGHVEAITAFLQHLVGQFQLTEARRR